MRRIRSLIAVGLLAVVSAIFVPVLATPAEAASLPTWATTIRNRASDNCVDQDWSGGVQHPTVLVYTCLQGSNQLWTLKSVGSGRYEIVNSKSGKCLNQDFSNNVRHSNVIAYTCSTSFTNGLWVPETIAVDPTYGQAYTFSNVKTGDWLNQDYSGGTAHTALLAWPRSATDGIAKLNEMWYFYLD